LAGIPIGQLLVEQGVLTARQVAHIVEVQRLSHRPFGDLAERLYGVSPEAIEDAWVTQYARQAGLTDLRGIQVDDDCLQLVNRRQAWQFYLLPIERDDQALTVATDADHLVRAVNFCARRLEEPVYFVLADKRQLRDFLMKHYPVPEHMAQYAEKL
jgi:hypothetical protein